jgi:Stage II sporulation protein E (SpoIIE)
MPLGLMLGMSYEENELVLDPGEGVFFYSDGLVEAHDPKGEMFGFPRLRELVAEHGEERSLGNFLLEELFSFVRGGLGAGGRHHPPYATTFRNHKLNFREHLFFYKIG